MNDVAEVGTCRELLEVTTVKLAAGVAPNSEADTMSCFLHVNYKICDVERIRSWLGTTY